VSDVGQISDFRTLLSTLSPDALTRGKQFERVTKWWLENDPIHSRQIEKVWLWDEWPEYPGRDIGIDLVARLLDGSLIAIQAKCVDGQWPTTRNGYTLTTCLGCYVKVPGRDWDEDKRELI
jgi:predicted helicase